MAENEKDVNKICKTNFLNEQTDEAKAKLLFKSKVYPNYNAVKDLPQKYQEHQEIKQSGDQSNAKLYQSINNQIKPKKHMNDNETERNVYSIIANNTFQMRLRVLRMETNVLKTYFVKQLIDNENDTWKNINKIKMYVHVTYPVHKINNLEQAGNELLIAENLSTALMRKIKSVLYTKAEEKEAMRNPEHNIQVPDYRSIVTVRGTEEDVKNCILKATAALKSGKYDRAESLLLKAERIFPTKNAMDLLKEVRSAKKLKQSPELIEKATKSVGHLYSIQNEKLRPEIDGVNADKCLTAFEKAFTDGKFVKAERLLHKAIRFNPSLNLEENMSRVKVAIANNIMEEKPMNTIEIANEELQIAEDNHYKTAKTYDIYDSRRVEQNVKDVKTLYTSLDLESVHSRNSTDETPKMRKSNQPIMNTPFEDQVYSLEQNKNNTLIRLEYDSNRDNSNKDDKKESANKNKLLYGRNLVHINVLGNSSKYNTDSKTIILPQKNQADFMYTTENASKNEKFENPINFPNTAETFKSIPLVKDRLEMVNDIHLPREENEYSNCYKFPVEDNGSNMIEALKCTKMAEKACQNYTNITVRTENKHNEHFIQHQDEQVNEYSKCIKLSSEAMARGDLTRSEHFLEKAIRINPNDSDKKQLHTIQAKKRDIEERLKREQEGEILQDLAVDAYRDKKFQIALFYIKLALKKQPNEKMQEQLQILKAKSEQGKKWHLQCTLLFGSPHYEKNETNKLLDKVSTCINTNNIEKAEFFLVLSWDLSKSQHTLLVSKQFVTARMAKHSGDKNHKNGGRNYENIIKSDELVKSVLNTLINKKFYETTEKEKMKEIESVVHILQAASKLHSSILIDKLLNVIPTKRTDVQSTNIFCSIL